MNLNLCYMKLLIGFLVLGSRTISQVGMLEPSKNFRDYGPNPSLVYLDRNYIIYYHQTSGDYNKI